MKILRKYGIAFWITIILVALFVEIYLLLSANKTTEESLNPKPTPTITVTPSMTPTLVVEAEENYLIFADSGTGNDEFQYQVAEQMTKFCQKYKCEKGFIAGDVIYEKGVSTVNDQQFQTKFEKPYKDLNIVLNIAFGNHDYLGCEGCYLEYAKISDKWSMPASYYMIEESKVAFIVIDTEKFDSAQQKWLKENLDNIKDKLVVLIGHRPLLTFEELYYGKTWDGSKELETIICNEVNLYFSGHAHVLEHVGKVDKCNFEQVVSGGGGRTPRALVANHKDIFGFAGNGFSILTIKSKDNYELRFFDKGGKEIYCFNNQSACSPLKPLQGSAGN